VRLLLLCVVLFIVYATLYPFQFDAHRMPGTANPVWILLHSWPRSFDRFAFRDTVTNLFLYMPLGFCAALAFGRRWWAAVLLGAGLSAGIEMLQVYDYTRTCSLADLVCNTLGAAAGAAVALLVPSRLLRRTLDGTTSGPLVLAACWVGLLLYPFVPILSRTHIAERLMRATQGPLSFTEFFAYVAEWFAAILVAEALVGKMRAGWLGLALLLLPVRLVLAERWLAADEVIGAVVAALLWGFIPAQRRWVWAAIIMSSAILLRELAPFDFTDQAQPFSWIPFAAIIEDNRGPAAVVLLRKAFEYGALIWLLRGFGVVLVGVGVASVLVITELVQRYIPGRQPEITDAVLALMMTGLLAWSWRR
jgi:VanZ family protein